MFLVDESVHLHDWMMNNFIVIFNSDLSTDSFSIIQNQKNKKNSFSLVLYAFQFSKWWHFSLLSTEVERETTQGIPSHSESKKHHVSWIIHPSSTLYSKRKWFFCCHNSFSFARTIFHMTTTSTIVTKKHSTIFALFKMS
jgi:hypothetical protein